MSPAQIQHRFIDERNEVEQLTHAIRDWLRAHPELLDETL